MLGFNEPKLKIHFQLPLARSDSRFRLSLNCSDAILTVFFYHGSAEEMWIKQPRKNGILNTNRLQFTSVPLRVKFICCLCSHLIKFFHHLIFLPPSFESPFGSASNKLISSHQVKSQPHESLSSSMLSFWSDALKPKLNRTLIRTAIDWDLVDIVDLWRSTVGYFFMTGLSAVVWVKCLSSVKRS